MAITSEKKDLIWAPNPMWLWLQKHGRVVEKRTIDLGRKRRGKVNN